jgi:hypothetical protein
LKKLAVLVAGSAVVATTAFAENPELKGIRMGMTRDEFTQAFPGGLGDDFTVALQKVSRAPDVQFGRDERLANVRMKFSIPAFYPLMSALKQKYKDGRCNDYKSQDKLLETHECFFEDARIYLRMEASPLASDTTLTLTSDERMKEIAQKQKADRDKQQKDL